MNDRNYDFLDIISVMSFYLAYRNLVENETQQKNTDDLIKKNDINLANDKQAKFLLEEISRKFNEQNKMLEEILKAVEKSTTYHL